MNPPHRFTDHALLRCAQRNISQEEVLYVIEHGHRHRNTGVLMCFLRRCDIPENDQKDQRIVQLIHTAVLVGNGEIITLYRNKNAMRDFRRRAKHQFNGKQPMRVPV